MINDNENDVAHHKRQEYCTTRLKYRQGRELKAVKVYTVANESKHLLIFGVPKINLQKELKRSCQRFGELDLVKCVTQEIAKKMELELFTDVFQVTFRNPAQARRAKRFLDAKQFYGGVLHISYAPEYESREELREKLSERRKEVEIRLKWNTKTK